MFLSTHEPIDKEGKPLNPVRSICNKFVFNTVITRSRSLVVAFGNPLLLINGSSKLSNNCWSEFIQRSITCQSFHLIQNTDNPSQLLLQQISELHEINFSHKCTSTEANITEDRSNKGYQKLLLSQKHERIAKYLVQNPKDIIGTKIWHDSDDSDSDEEVITGKIELLSHRTGKIVFDNPSISDLTISLAEERRCHFSGQEVRVKKISKKIIVDVETVRAVNKKMFGKSFPCRVHEDDMIKFYPFIKTVPILSNMPILTKYFPSGVVCFDPSSIEDRPKICNYIPKECAISMVFTVTYLRWGKSHRYPLGIVTGAFPCGKSVYTGDRLLRMMNDIPKSDNYLDYKVVKTDCPSFLMCREFKNVITIDPHGSKDHDDALSCTQKGVKKFEIGVHITDVQAFVQKGSEIDLVAKKRGCSVYSSAAECVSNMLPMQVVQAASILPDGQTRDSFSVTAMVVFSPKHDTVKHIEKIEITKSRILSKHELTYEEVQMSLFDAGRGDLLHKDLVRLWVFVCHLRSKRLKAAAKHLSVGEEDEIANPEAHVLVEELMIWANSMVAEKLFDYTPAIQRCQPPSRSFKLDQLIKTHGQQLAVSLDLQQHIPLDQRDCRDVTILQETIDKMAKSLKEGNIREALHLIQFEHLQPQVAVAHALYNMIRERASYCVTRKGDSPENYSHDSLKCTHYTHFTSPIRRYIDLVIQRMLFSVLIEESCANNASESQTDITSVYKIEELEDICKATGEKLVESDRYENDRRGLDLALQLQQSSREYICFVKSAGEGELTWTFPDIKLKTASQFVKGIKLKHLNAADIPKNDSPVALGDNAFQPLNRVNVASWKVKFASAEGIPINFFANPLLSLKKSTDSQTKDQFSSDRSIKISMFTGVDDETLTEKTDLKQITLNATVRPFTKTICADNWRQMQEHVRSLDTNFSANDPESIQKLLPTSTPPPQCQFPISPSPLWVYELNRPLQNFEVLRVQLTGCFNSSIQMISSAVQLLEVGPNLRVCIQHNHNPAECFTSSSMAKPLHKIANIQEYFLKWEQALLAEAATASILDTELLIITDVKLQWPKLIQVIDSQGCVFYQLPVDPANESPEDNCVCMKLSECFATSNDFFDIKRGDLMCVRCFENGGDVRAVFHMVVQQITEIKPNQLVYLKFVGEKANYISPVIHQTLDQFSYEIQLIPLTLPFRLFFY